MLQVPGSVIIDINSFRDLPVDDAMNSEFTNESLMVKYSNSMASVPINLKNFVSTRDYQDWKSKSINIDQDKIQLSAAVTTTTHLDRYCKCLLITNWISHFGGTAVLPTTKEIFKLLEDSSVTECKTKYASSTIRYKKALIQKMVFFYS
jgi:hypothetical protein